MYIHEQPITFVRHTRRRRGSFVRKVEFFPDVSATKRGKSRYFFSITPSAILPNRLRKTFEKPVKLIAEGSERPRATLVTISASPLMN
ncbi:hypothetical protein H2202_002927 [Exophiala xenobiotica]|nr:hypothetical protein H2202_002927 [Exophiala xenobiotica]